MRNKDRKQRVATWLKLFSSTRVFFALSYTKTHEVSYLEMSTHRATNTVLTHVLVALWVLIFKYREEGGRRMDLCFMPVGGIKTKSGAFGPDHIGSSRMRFNVIV